MISFLVWFGIVVAEMFGAVAAAPGGPAGGSSGPFMLMFYVETALAVVCAVAEISYNRGKVA